jgi:hypothetical protein
MNAAIATKLNILESAIVRIEEWAHVLFVVVKGLGARFVSKKVIQEEEENKMTVSINCDVDADAIRFVGKVAFTLHNVSLLIKYEGAVKSGNIPWCISSDLTNLQIEELAKQATTQWLSAQPTTIDRSYQMMTAIDQMERRMYSANSHC